MLVLFPFFGMAQSQQPYFQQEVNYQIDVKIDDETHYLHAHEEVDYKNNSPDTLYFIYFHLWPNGYAHKHTALCRQLNKNNDPKLYFAEESQKGRIDSLHFTSQGNPLKWEYLKKNQDICKIFLSKPLAPGERVKIETPFRVKIPGDFSRLGRQGQRYQISQWYPKPAVYDRDGWHPMPYLDQGEFYSEFGSFTVNISVPKNYRVGATGVLQNEEEKAWLLNLSQEAKNLKTFEKSEPIPSSKEWKTLQYKQDNIHDFAWFCAKDYYVMKSEVKLPGGAMVDTWAFFTHQKSAIWKKATQYLDSSVYYYSLWVGDYPYPSATAVEGALSAGGGMEYPMITVVSAGSTAKELDEIITHEIGHNWFYGILASNERAHTWMDEGFNSYFEHRYMQKFYPNESFLSGIGVEMNLKSMQSYDRTRFLYQSGNFFAGHGYQFPINTKADEFTNLQYAFLSYQKTAHLLVYLEQYLGTTLFDQCMQAYYKEWQFKHPSPHEVKQLFEKTAGKKLDWWFTDLINTRNTFDYRLQNPKIQGDSLSFRIKNTGQIAGPFPIQFIGKNDEVLSTFWVEGFNGTKKLKLAKPKEAKTLVIDHRYQTPDIWRSNNHLALKGILKRMEPLKLKPISFVSDHRIRNLYYLPALGGNRIDGFMLGAAFHNIHLNGQKGAWLIMPMYAFGSQQLNGSAFAKRDFHLTSQNNWHKVRFSVLAKRFSYVSKIEPALSIYSAHKPGKLSSMLQLSYAYIQYANPEANETTRPGTVLFQPTGQGGEGLNRFKALWVGRKKTAIMQLSHRLSAEYYTEGLLRIELKQDYSRKLTKKSKIEAHFYAGYLADNQLGVLGNLFTASSSDLGMDNYQSNRSFDQGSNWMHRPFILNDQGGMYHINESTNSLLITAGLRYQYKKIPVLPYTNLGFLNDKVLLESGFALNLGLIELMLPVGNSNQTNFVPANLNQWSEGIRWRLRLNTQQIFNSVELMLP